MPRARLTSFAVAAALVGGLFVAALAWALHVPDVASRAAPAQVPVPPPRPVDPAAAVADDEPGGGEDTPAAAVATSGVPDQLDRMAIEGAMERLQPQLARCRPFERWTGILELKLVIQPGGSVSSATLLPPRPGPLTGNQPPAPLPQGFGECLVKAARQASFPRYKGTFVRETELVWPLVLGLEP